MDFSGVKVEMNLDEAWNSNRVTDEGREGLRKFGLAPPPKYEGVLELDVLSDVPCPNCASPEHHNALPLWPDPLPCHPPLQRLWRNLRAIQAAMIPS